MMPLENLRLGLLQTALDWEDAEANVARIDQHIAALNSPVDLIVLPEMWATGFTMRPKVHGMRWTDDQPVPHAAWPSPLRAMLRWAQSHDAAVVGSLACQMEGQAAAVNRCFFITPDGQIAQYDKRHTFTFAGEDQHYQAGQHRVEVQWRGWRILLQICYDLRFPVLAEISCNNRTILLFMWRIGRPFEALLGPLCCPLEPSKTKRTSPVSTESVGTEIASNTGAVRRSSIPLARDWRTRNRMNHNGLSQLATLLRFRRTAKNFRC